MVMLYSLVSLYIYGGYVGSKLFIHSFIHLWHYLQLYILILGGIMDMTLTRYIEMMNQQCDERPLYLFDKAFGEKRPSLLQDYIVPSYFQNDLFDLLPSNGYRPRFR